MSAVSIPVAPVEGGSQTVELLCARLKKAGYRITNPRRALLAALLRQSHPVSIETLHGELEQGTCDLVTVYRCMDSFEKIGLVHRIFQPNGTVMFEVDQGRQNFYLLGVEDQTVTKLADGLVDELAVCVQRVTELLKQRGHGNVTAVVEFFSQPVAAPEQS